MPKIYVLHHDDNDGYASALALYELYGEKATYIPVQYGQKFPDIELDKDTAVYIVDFSYDRATLEDVDSKVLGLLVLDHHETAEEQLKGFDRVVFDKTKAGATLCWNYFHPDKEVPYLFKLVEDYDLYKFEYEDTRKFNYGMSALGKDKDLQSWSDVLHSSHILEEVIQVGGILKENVDSQIKKFKDRKSYKITTDNQGRRFALYNTGSLINEMAEALYTDPSLELDYTMSYFFTNEGKVVFSLRSNKDNPNAAKVNLIAQEMSKEFRSGSGGGHPNSAGCNTSFSKGTAFLAGIYDLFQE